MVDLFLVVKWSVIQMVVRKPEQKCPVFEWYVWSHGKYHLKTKLLKVQFSDEFGIQVLGIQMVTVFALLTGYDTEQNEGRHGGSGRFSKI